MKPMCSHSSIISCLHECMLSHFSHVWLFMTQWTIACQDPLSIGFSRQEYCSGLPSPPPEVLPDPGIEPTSLTSPALAGRFFTTSATWEDTFLLICLYSWSSELTLHFSCLHMKSLNKKMSKQLFFYLDEKIMPSTVMYNIFWKFICKIMNVGHSFLQKTTNLKQTVLFPQ